jgi:hypothetical protein
MSTGSNNGSNTGSVIATNVIAESILESLKSGLVVKGTVRSHAREGSIDTAWIEVDFPGIGSRQVAVHCEQSLQVGQEVVIQCVPNPLNPGRYKFEIAAEPSPEAHLQSSAEQPPAQRTEFHSQ